MTEEELRKESTSTVQWKYTQMIDRPTFVNGYITGAKPREERIAELEKENAMLKEHCMKFSPNAMIEFGAFVLYYTANPESKMDIPSCAYEKVEKMYENWNKKCEDCVHSEELKKAIQEGKQGSTFGMLECNDANRSGFKPNE